MIDAVILYTNITISNDEEESQKDVSLKFPSRESCDLFLSQIENLEEIPSKHWLESWIYHVIDTLESWICPTDRITEIETEDIIIISVNNANHISDSTLDLTTAWEIWNED